MDFVSPFAPFKNSVLTFEVEDKNSEVTDESGNVKPGVKTIVLDAYLKQTLYKSNTRIQDDYPGVGLNAVLMTGYLVEYNEDKLPRGLFLMKRTVKCIYQGQEGTLIIAPQVQSSVGAHKYTGIKLTGVFQILGGQ